MHSKFVAFLAFDRTLRSALELFQLSVGEGGGDGIWAQMSLNTLSLISALYRINFFNGVVGDFKLVSEIKLSYEHDANRLTHALTEWILHVVSRRKRGQIALIRMPSGSFGLPCAYDSSRCLERSE